MKKIIFIICFGLTAAVVPKAKAQVSINVNIGSQPLWGPAGYDYADYYYLPEIETYYSVPRHQFIYLSNGQWVFSSGLPPRYAGYNLYRGYKVVLNSPRPYRYFNDHKVKYAGYRSMHNQLVIRNSREPKYFVVKGHPGKAKGHYKRHDGQGRGNGGGRGHGHGKH
ncbi:hypothetical protein [Pedobacter sp. JY14-1]|uniref:hypothetical protein n=1 Tax=Pedobacter sp. JY14-1 TaxID=3034151 RepID=UPI0023E0A578|nr:hypothetical protein [Pedobacter sp. JY14-1]